MFCHLYTCLNNFAELFCYLTELIGQEGINQILLHIKFILLLFYVCVANRNQCYPSLNWGRQVHVANVLGYNGSTNIEHNIWATQYLG